MLGTMRPVLAVLMHRCVAHTFRRVPQPPSSCRYPNSVPLLLIFRVYVPGGIVALDGLAALRCIARCAHLGPRDGGGIQQGGSPLTRSPHRLEDQAAAIAFALSLMAKATMATL
jgi:hypothetical protein